MITNHSQQNCVQDVQHTEQQREPSIEMAAPKLSCLHLTNCKVTDNYQKLRKGHIYIKQS